MSGLTAGTNYSFDIHSTLSNWISATSTTVSAATYAAPVITLNTATSISTTTATLNGSVNSENDTDTVKFCYSTNQAHVTSCNGGSTLVTVTSASGSSATPESSALTGLSTGTTYYYNLEAISSGGVTYYGTPTSFTTAAVPTVTNGSAGSITASGATLSGGSVNANNDPNTHTIEYCYSTTSLNPGSCTGGTVSTVAGSNPTASGSSNTAESATLSGLAANTKYYFNLEATNSAGTVTYGTVGNFTTLNAPVVTTGTAGSITTSGAALSGGSVNAESGSVTSIQFCYSTTSLTNCTGGTVSTVAGSNPTANGSSSTAETATLSSLSAGTTYYVNLEGTSAGVTYYGTPTSFTTAAVPTVTNGSAGSITASGATLSGGSVNANNDPNTHTIEYCYSTTSLNPGSCTGGTVSTVAGSNPTASGSSNTAESATLSGLAANTKYYFNLEATNSAGTVTYGTVGNFTTLNAPVVTTGTAGSITTSGAALSGGSVNAESGSVTSIQFCYSTTSLTNCTGGTVSTVAGSNPTANGSSSTAETATLSSLSAGTTYYVNLEGTSAGVTYYGTPTSFTTAAVPTVTNGSAGSITASGATLSGGSVNANNDPNTHTIEYCYSTTSLNPGSCTGGTVSTVAGSNPTASGSSNTAESATLSGLAANTKYYFNLEATNSAGTVTYGTVGNFTTLNAPVVTTGTAGSITTSGAALSGGSVNAESGSVTSIQFCYSTTSLTNCTGGTVSTVAGSNPTANGSSSTAETATLSSLSAGTTYYVNLEGTSAGVTYYGTPTSFTTAAVPTVTNGSAGSITASGATLSGGSVNANNDPNTHTIEYCYSTTSLNPGSCTGGTVSTVAGSNPTASGSSNTAESATLSGLAANTKYYFNLEATNSAGTVTYGTVGNFTTLNAPVVTTGTAGSITTSGAALSGGSVNAESGSVTSIQFCYSTTSLTNCTGGTVSTVAGSNPTANGSSSTAETATLSSLSAGTTYYVNLEGTSAGVTYYGTPTSFTTAAVPTVTNGSAGSITASGATLSGGSVNANNDPNTHTIEYCYSTTSLNPGSCTGGTVSTVAGSNPTASGSSNTAESATLSGLAANTKYYFNLEATNSAGTVTYGTVGNFTTLNAPVVTTGTAGSITTSGAALSGGSVNAESGSVTSIQFCYSTTSLTNCTGGTVSTVAGSNPTANGSSSTAETATLSSLSAGTTYYVNLEGTSAGVTYYGTPTSFTTSATLGATQIMAASNAETNNASSVTSNTFATAANGSTVLILVSYYNGGSSKTCNSIANHTGTPLTITTTTPIVSNDEWNSSSGNDYGMCAFKAKGTSTSGTVTVTMSTGTDDVAIQVIEITGDNNAAIGINGTGSGTGNSPSFTLSGTQTSGSSEILFGDETAGTLRNWAATASPGFSQTGTTQTVSGVFNAAVYFGPTHTPATGTLTGSGGTAAWGTTGIEIKP